MRRRPFMARLAVAALLVSAVSATWGVSLAQPVPYLGLAGGEAWARGEFVTAYEQASQVGTAAAQLLASRAASDQAVYRETTADAATVWLRLAEATAQKSLDLEPEGPLAAAATMALARAKGEAALHRGMLSNTRLPGELRALFERTLMLDPGNADALVAYGAWHLELTERGVGWLYGGDRSQALPLLERGVAAAPEQLNLRVEYAKALRTLGHEVEAREQLRVAVALPVITAADALEQGRALALLGTL